MYAKKRNLKFQNTKKGGKKIAIYLAKLTSGKKGSAVKKYDYIMRERSYGKNYDDLIGTGTLNMPYWAKSGRHFFEMADRYERANGATFKQLIVSLPAELSQNQNIELAKEIAEKILDTTKAGCWAIHSKPAVTKNVTNIHMHLMFNDRIIVDEYNIKKANLFFRRFNPKEPDKGGYKKDDRFASFGKKAKDNINWMRQEIETIINNGYKKAGLKITVSHKSLKEQHDDAIKNGEYELAETLNREPIKFLDIRNWKRIQSVLEKNNAIDFSHPIPLKPTIKTIPAHEKLLEENPKLYLKFHKRIESLELKLKLEMQKNQNDQNNIAQEISYVSGYEYKNLLNNLTSRIRKRLQRNRRYNILYEKIYSSAKVISDVINNVITRGRIRKYQKTEQLIKQTESRMQKIISENKLTPDISMGYQSLIESYTEQLKRLDNEILKIVKQETTPQRFNQIKERLRKSHPAAKKKYQTNNINQKEYLKIINEITEIQLNITNEMTIPLNQNAIKVFQSNQNVNIKELSNAIKDAKEYLNNNKPKNIKESKNENQREKNPIHKDDYSR